jgi:hypothetical protein
MKSIDGPLKYIGQTGRTFHARYKEHIQAIRNNNSNSAYSSHIMNKGHTYGSITDTVDTTRTQTVGKLLNALEKYHIYTYTKSVNISYT